MERGKLYLYICQFYMYICQCNWCTYVYLASEIDIEKRDAREIGRRRRDASEREQRVKIGELYLYMSYIVYICV